MADVCELELYGDSPVESPTVADGAKAVAKRLRGIAKKGYLKEKRERTRVDRRKFNRLTTVVNLLMLLAISFVVILLGERIIR